jgi:ParB family chromosome partitioning protein
MPKKQPKPGFSDVFSTQASAPTGKALDTLFADQRIDSAAERVVGDIGRSSTLLPVAALVPNPYQPRKAFDADELQSLADSIREEGVLERLLVRRSPTQAQVYEIAAGERRWRAAKLAGLKEVPCDILEECPDARMKRIGIIENVLRVGLKPLELAEAYRSLLEEHDEQERPVYTIRSLAEQLGLPKDNIDSHLALLRVQPEVRRLIEEDPSIPLRIIREIGGIESEEDRALLIGEVRSRSLNQPDVLAILQQARHG